MTRFVYHLAAALAILIVQTTVISRLPLLARFYDPALLMVAYLALSISFWHGLGMVMLMGAAMGQVSAAPFGLYFFAYLWLFLLVRWSALFLHAKNVLVLSLLVAAMVVGQHLLFWALTALTVSGPVFGPEALNHALWQSLWALGTGAAGVHCLLQTQMRVCGWMQRARPSADGQ